MENVIDNKTLVGYSSKIDNPAFEKYVKNSNKYASIFAAVLAFAAIVGFYIAGETSSDMNNPEALYIGFVIGSMFLLIAFFQVRSKNKSKTWDGEVINKEIKKKRNRRNSGDDSYWQDYIEYIVSIKDENGKSHHISVDDDDTRYNYFVVGDKVRHHKGLNSYEKYDKSNDSIVFCNACASMNNITDEFCFRCKCPLLK